MFTVFFYKDNQNKNSVLLREYLLHKTPCLNCSIFNKVCNFEQKFCIFNRIYYFCSLF